MWITRNTSGLRRVYTWNNQTSPSGPPPPATSPSAKTNDGRYRVSTIYGVTNFFSPFFSTTPDGNNNHIRSLLPCSVLAVYTIYSISMCVYSISKSSSRKNERRRRVWGRRESIHSAFSFPSQGFYEDGRGGRESS